MPAFTEAAKAWFNDYTPSLLKKIGSDVKASFYDKPAADVKHISENLYLKYRVIPDVVSRIKQGTLTRDMQEYKDFYKTLNLEGKRALVEEFQAQGVIIQ